MDNDSILNLIVALARALNLDPGEVAELFNEREDNQAYWDQLVAYQRTLDNPDKEVL